MPLPDLIMPMQKHLLLKIAGCALLCVALIFNSCKKAAEDAVDCFGQSLFVSFNHNQNDTNSRKVDFTIKYAGKLPIASIRLEYGDGQSQTISGSTASHTYNAAGNYEVKAWVTLQNGDGTCEVNPVKQLNIN